MLLALHYLIQTSGLTNISSLLTREAPSLLVEFPVWSVFAEYHLLPVDSVLLGISPKLVLGWL